MADGNGEPSKPPGSDQKIDRFCMPCKDKNVPADRFCIECEAYFCAHCSQHFHTAIPVLAKHVILKDDEINVLGQLKYKCDIHNEMFTFFCKDHDALCCTVCIHLEHSACKEKEYIQTAAEGICDAQGLEQLKAEIKGIQDTLSECTKKFQLKSKVNLESKHKVTDSIKQHRQKINALFDALDQSALKQMETKFDSNKIYISESLNKLTSYSNESTLLNQQVNLAREDKNCLVYICLKQGNELVKIIKQNVSGMDSTTSKDNFAIGIDEKIEYFIKTRKETGHIEDDHSRSSDECGAKREIIPQDKGDLICQLEENKKLLEKDIAEMQNTIKAKDSNISALEDKVRDISRQNDDLKKTRDDLERRVQDLENGIKTQQEHMVKTEETCKALIHGNDLGVVLPTLCKELSVLNGSKLRDLYKDIEGEVDRLSIRKLKVQVYDIGDIKAEEEFTACLLVSRFSAYVPQATAIIVISRPLGPYSTTENHGSINVLKYLTDVYQCGMVCAVSVKGSILEADEGAVNKILWFIRTFNKGLS
ncbi:uncharacterized protein LOC128554327 isoform X2 [Mercenaria mercenaria]|uniref:uncharacterized protein LOC128554327 isoform X2 n=1 Tax=Mercenaria mercenaria TaxID=6596 RepID=UPI00234F165C|nr:uncharacterized protein LOC128554327 isoform X2 [Mercenaria mercenaria]